MMLRRPTGSRLAAGAAATVVAVTAVLVLPAPAHAAERKRAESAYDSESSKTATATCDPGEVVIGAGGRVKDGDGRVRLAAIIPTLTSVEVRADELSEGHDGSWSVVAFAVCESQASVSPTVEASQPGSSTATCDNGTVPSGTGFELPAGSVLTGLVPDAEGTGVTVRTPFQLIGGDGPVAYAICMEGERSSWGGIGPRYTRFEEPSPVDGSSPKTVTVSDWFDSAGMSGVGAEVTGPGPISRLGSGVFIDTMMPSDDLLTVKVQAVHRPSDDDVSTVPTRGRLVGTSVAGDEDDDWSVTGYGLDHQYY
ncbi:MAG TPA: hypothetical protein VFR67_27015 [Pilimelia sp.]|nr:hypothetical protein [Pilimelia sp.]